MKSIQDELRMCAADHSVARDYTRSVCGSAAAEIERLRAALTRLMADIDEGFPRDEGYDMATAILADQQQVREI